jgi:S-formylglutathione hydrolase FrmB
MLKGKKRFSKHPVPVSAVLFVAFMNFFCLLPAVYASPVVTPVTVNEQGFDAQGRMVAYFGSPVVDGIVDNIWSKAPVVTPKYVSANVETTATFRALWDREAIYILAEVKDKNMSVQSGNPYMQDSLEIFLDENNDKTQDYGVDDLHFRVNYENTETVDVGNVARFYTAAQITADGYVIEARIAFKYSPANNKVLGIELQINDAVGANRVGTINVFDSTNGAWNDTAKFGEVLLTGKTCHSKIALNPYNLKTLIRIAQKMDLTLYTNPNILTNAIKIAEKVLDSKRLTQRKIDKQYAALKKAISKLIFTEAAANEKYFTVVPDEYRAVSVKPGTIENLEYTAVNPNNGTDTKHLNVYLPFGYNAADASKKYNVLYLMHGYGENENTVFGGPGQNKELKKILDNMIAKGDIAPMIVVTPSFYGGMNDIAVFHQELMTDVLPLIETKYHTYAASASPYDLKASRAHRAFGGFSMGAATTWNIYVNCIDYFKYYMPLSGGAWTFGFASDPAQFQAIAENLANVPKNTGYTPKDYYIFCATGSQDIAYPTLKPQVDAMKLLTDSFIYSANTTKGNFYFIVSDGGTHAWNWTNQYIYDILPDLFKN